jgi:hypothetical protein
MGRDAFDLRAAASRISDGFIDVVRVADAAQPWFLI